MEGDQVVEKSSGGVLRRLEEEGEVLSGCFFRVRDIKKMLKGFFVSSPILINDADSRPMIPSNVPCDLLKNKGVPMPPFCRYGDSCFGGLKRGIVIEKKTP